VALFRRKSEADAADTPEAPVVPHDHERIGGLQTSLSRLVATGGIIGIGTGVAAIMGTQDVAAWIIGIVTAGVSVLLAAVVWSSRSL
jgi:hypothetical protein